MTAACGSSGPSAPAPNPRATASTPSANIPATQDFVTYTPKKGRYSLRRPKGWHQQDIEGATTFSDGNDEIAVATTTQPKPPTIANVRSNYLLSLRPLLGFRLVKIDTVARPAGRTVRIVYEATSVPDRFGKRIALDVERYLFWRNRQLLTITLAAPHGSNNVRVWRTVTNSVAWK